MSFIADTNLCSKVPGNPGVEARWNQLRGELEGNGLRYAISPLVLLELLVGLVTPEPNHFQSDLRRFHFLAGDGDAELLLFPGAFVLKTVLGVPSPVARFGSADFAQWLSVTRAAPTRDQLVAGDVELYRSELLSYGLDLGKIAQQHNEGRDEYIRHMEMIRERKPALSSRNVRAIGFLRRQGIIPQKTDISKLVTAMDAVETYYENAFKLAVDTDYEFSSPEHSGDSVDFQLLYYLSDPEMYIVTADRKLKKRVSSSQQSARIHVI